MIQSELEEALQSLPTQVGTFLFLWKKAKLDLEVLESKKRVEYRHENPKMSATDITALIHATPEWYKMSLNEITKEAAYVAKDQTLMAVKKQCDFNSSYRVR